MIISSQQIQMVLRQYGVHQTKGVEDRRPVEDSKTGREEVDRAEFSREAATFQKAREAAKKAPEIREDRVREIKEALARGEYSVSARDVAEKMLGRSIVDRLV